MVGLGMHGFVANRDYFVDDIDDALSQPTDKRVFYLAQALHEGYSIDRLYELTKIDRWFLYKLKHIIDLEKELMGYNSLSSLPDKLLYEAKKMVFLIFRLHGLFLNAVAMKWMI